MHVMETSLQDQGGEQKAWTVSDVYYVLFSSFLLYLACDILYMLD